MYLYYIIHCILMLNTYIQHHYRYIHVHSIYNLLLLLNKHDQGVISGTTSLITISLTNLIFTIPLTASSSFLHTISNLYHNTNNLTCCKQLIKSGPRIYNQIVDRPSPVCHIFCNKSYSSLSFGLPERVRRTGTICLTLIILLIIS